MKRIKMSYTSQLLVFAAIYFITGKLGLEIGAVSGFATLVWFPTGISLVVLFLYGYRLWPAIFLGAFFVNLVMGASFFPAVAIGTGNTLEAVVGAYVLQRYVLFRSSLDRMRDVLGLTLLAGPISAAISATIGIGSLWLAHAVTFHTFGSTWLAWWVGDVISDMIVAPFLFVSLTAFSQNVKRARSLVEELGLITLTIVSTWIVFTSPAGAESIVYLIFPPLIWAAIRFNPAVVITAVFSIFSIAVLTTALEFGPFASKSISENLLRLQSFMSVVSFSSLVFAAVVSERNRFEERKDDFINMASHELKTPVTSMKIYLDILLDRLTKAQDEKSAKIVSNIKLQVEKLQDIVSDLLDVSRIQSQKLQFHKEEFRIDALIKEVIENLQVSTKQHKLLYKNASKIIIYGDRFRIYQVLTNLLTNAIKYSPKQTPIIVRVLEDKGKIIVSVQDFGLGVSEDQQKRIFDQFYQVDDPEEKTFPGLGMGLYISKEIVSMHGGEIWVESEKGKGSTFFFILPSLSES